MANTNEAVISTEEKLLNGYDPISDGILLFNSNDVNGIANKGRAAIRQLYKVTHERPKGILVELNIYRKYVPDLIEYCLEQKKFIDAGNVELERLYSKTSEKHMKRWTKEEDDLLIEYVCRDLSVNELSTMFGRSPSAISGRVSALVGRKRLSKEVAGKFIGFIDGEEKEAEICGTVYKNDKEE